MAKRLKHRGISFVVLYFFIVGITGLLLLSRYHMITDNYIQQHVREFDQRIESYQLMQQKMIHNYYGLFLNSPEITQIMAEAAHSSPQRQEQLRHELMERTAPMFGSLKNFDVRLLFFHLPEQIAFLRLHKPEKFGDSLRTARPSIVAAQTRRQKLVVFETGKLFDGFRTIYPLFHQGQFVGTVEIAYPFMALKKQAMLQLPGAYTFLIKRTIQEKKSNAPAIAAYYQESPFGNEYYEDKESALRSGAKGFREDELNTLLSDNKEVIRNALKEKKLQGIQLRYDGKYALLVLKPVSEMGGEHAAYMVELTADHPFFADEREQMIEVLIAVALLLALLMWYIYRYNRSKIILEQYKQAIDENMIVSKTDPEGIITYVNQRFIDISGYSEAELIGKPHSIVRHPDTSAGVFKTMWKTIQKGKVWHGGLQNRSKKGETYYVNSTICPILDENGELIEFIGLREDVTQLVESTKRIEDEKRRFDAIFQHQNSIVVFTTDAGRVEMVNRRFFDYFDFPDLKTFQQTHHCSCSLFLEREGYLFATSFSQYLFNLQEASPEERKVLVLDREGRERILSVEFSAIDLSEGVFYIFAYHDISELESARQREEKLRIQAQRSEMAKMEFLANMSHEIRTPLNGIVGFAQLLSDAPLPAENRRQAKIISEQSKTLIGVINDILDLSKIESGNMTLEKVWINPFVELESAFSLFLPIASEKGIDYTIIVGSSIRESIGIDPIRLKQVMTNLISNALKFTPEGGAIRVEVQVLKEAPSSQRLCFSVTDSGIGIAPEKLATIFSPFVQEDSSTTRRFGGTGLGLSISSNLVKLFGGELQVESEKGKGSRFWFEIEVASGAQEESLAFRLRNRHIAIAVSEKRGYAEVKQQLRDLAIAYSDLERNTAADRYDLVITFDEEEAANMAETGEGRFGQIVLIGEPNRGFAADGVTVIDDYDHCPSRLYNTLLSAAWGESGESSGSVAAKVWHGKRLLVAEDYEVNQMLLEALLGIRGIVPDLAGNGKEACEMIERGEYDLVLMDINMPIMDGVEATRRIRATHPDLPIVALTANALQGDEERFLQEGMSGYLTKPIDAAALSEVLEKFLGE